MSVHGGNKHGENSSQTMYVPFMPILEWLYLYLHDLSPPSHLILTY
jgi:hypothetical protein